MSTQLISILLFISLVISCSSDKINEKQTSSPPVEVTVAKPGAQSGSKIYATGHIVSKEKAVISARVMGYISSIAVQPGDYVPKGKTLLTISNDDIMAKRAQAQALVTETEAAMKDAQKDYNRFTSLYQSQSASQKEYERAALQYESVKARYEGARAMFNEAEAMLSYTNIKAPFSGIITSRNADVGSMANPGVPLLTLEAKGGYEVEAFVTETDIARIEKGLPATTTIKSNGAVLRGEVIEISPSAALTSGQYYVKISIANDVPKSIYGGMAASVIIHAPTTTQPTAYVLVPHNALVFKDQLVGIYTVSQHQTALLRWVKTGKHYGDQVEILSGLSGTEEFISSSKGKLYNGAPIKRN
jgi:RND family efflux transporter MFP subunit